MIIKNQRTCNQKGHVKQSNNSKQPKSNVMSEGKEEHIVCVAGCVSLRTQSLEGIN